MHRTRCRHRAYNNNNATTTTIINAIATFPNDCLPVRFNGRSAVV